MSHARVLICRNIWPTHPLIGTPNLTLLSIVLKFIPRLRPVPVALALWLVLCLGLAVYRPMLLYRQSRCFAEYTV